VDVLSLPKIISFMCIYSDSGILAKRYPSAWIGATDCIFLECSINGFSCLLVPDLFGLQYDALLSYELFANAAILSTSLEHVHNENTSARHFTYSTLCLAIQALKRLTSSCDHGKMCCQKLRKRYMCYFKASGYRSAVPKLTGNFSLVNREQGR